MLVASHKMAYRLHADVLARQSAVFNDMLNLDDIPRPALEDTMDGCPIVHITDSPEDFDTFLSLVYDGFKYACSFFATQRLADRPVHQTTATACERAALDYGSDDDAPRGQIRRT